MRRHVSWAAGGLLLLAGTCPAAELPVAPPPRPKMPLVVVRSVKPTDDSATSSRSFVLSYGLTHRDLDLIRKLPGVSGVVPVRAMPSEVRHLDRLANARVVATVAGYAEVHALRLSAGRFLTERDDADRSNICVLGPGTAASLFPFTDSLGESVTIRGHAFRVVGVLAEKPGADGRDLYVPLATSSTRFGEVISVRSAGSRSAERVQLSEILVTAADGKNVVAVAEAVREVLKKEHAKKDWEVTAR